MPRQVTPVTNLADSLLQAVWNEPYYKSPVYVLIHNNWQQVWASLNSPLLTWVFLSSCSVHGSHTTSSRDTYPDIDPSTALIKRVVFFHHLQHEFNSSGRWTGMTGAQSATIHTWESLNRGRPPLTHHNILASVITMNGPCVSNYNERSLGSVDHILWTGRQSTITAPHSSILRGTSMAHTQPKHLFVFSFSQTIPLGVVRGVAGGGQFKWS